MKLIWKLGLAIGVAITLLLLPARVQSEQLETFDGFLVHYNALSSDQLPPEVAKTYGLQRSSHRGLLNITVQKDNGAAAATPLGAVVNAYASNLAGQRTEVPMREIREDDAIYYIGEFSVAGSDTLSFEVRIKPSGASSSHTLKFSKNYVTD
ncbi:MAG: DUF4426 domain-containing protein [Tahibacter sp.]